MQPNHPNLEVPAALEVGAPVIPVAAEAPLLGFFSSGGSNDVFDSVARIAIQVLQVPLVWMCVLDGHRQWFKSIAALDEA